MDDVSNGNHQLNSPGIQKLQAIVASKKIELQATELSRYPSLGVGLDYISIAKKNLAKLAFRIMVKMLFLQNFI